MGEFKNEVDALKFLSYLYEERQLGERTVNLYKFYYQHFDPAMISQEYVDQFILEHKNTTAVRGMIQNYLNMREITEIKLPERARGNKPKRLIRGITPDEIEKVRTQLYKEAYKKGLIFDLIYQGALRRVEIITIKIGSFRWAEWIDDVSKMCKLVVLGKGNKERKVLINPETAEMILQRLLPRGVESIEQIERLGNSQTLLFSKSNGDHLTEKQVYDIVKRGSLRAIGRDVRPHELRHNRATELEKRGVPVRDIKNYLGHTRISTTEIYLHKSGDESISDIENNLRNGESS
jgi:site-specific recombinase XerD